MSADFWSRVLGMVVFFVLGGRLGTELAVALLLPVSGTSLVFALVGILFGLIVTPWITIRPVRALYRTVSEIPLEVLFTSLLGLLLGLVIGLLIAYPFSQLPDPWGTLLPPAMTVVLAYLFTTICNARSREVWIFLHEWLGIGSKQLAVGGREVAAQYLLDTSILIDGRIVDIARTGFLSGTLLVPRFVISELHRVADSSDMQRRNRGRRGLAKLNDLQRDPTISFRIIEDDAPDAETVDDKLIALAVQLSAPILTIDFPMNQVASAQGVTVLNINALANAVRSAFIPGETFSLRILQEGREAGQGVGYLEDGTQVIVENGRQFLDRTISVEVTKLINKEAGRIIFAKPVERTA